jgi:hypothetical protein
MKRPQIVVRDDGGELRRMLEDLRVRERPVPTHSDIIRRLVKQAWESRAAK